MSEYIWTADEFDAIRIVAANGEFEINGVEGNKVTRRRIGPRPAQSLAQNPRFSVGGSI